MSTRTGLGQPTERHRDDDDDLASRPKPIPQCPPVHGDYEHSAASKRSDRRDASQVHQMTFLPLRFKIIIVISR